MVTGLIALGTSFWHWRCLRCGVPVRQHGESIRCTFPRFRVPAWRTPNEDFPVWGVVLRRAPPPVAPQAPAP